MIRLARTIAIVAFAAIFSAALAGCGGSGIGGALGPAPSPGRTPSGPVDKTIVGLGDSLTFGEQSDGELGQVGVALPDSSTLFSPIAAIGMIPPTQENGWFSLLYSDAKGLTWTAQAGPATSVLPLIAGPGLGDQILPANPAYTGGIPFSTVPGRSSCDSFNVSAYSYANGGAVRINPSSTTYDLGIPSLTLAEAIGMRNPLTTTCTQIYNPPTNTAQAEIDGLQALISGESELYYPVMEHYSTPASPVTPLQAAEQLNPTLTTVWLGANDLLRFIFSGGTAPGIDTSASQVQKDMGTIVGGLKHDGSYVVVATIPNVIETPQFAIVSNPSSQTQCGYQTYLACLFVDFGYPFANAEAEAALVQSSNPQLAGNSYLTETGVIYLLGEIAAGGPTAVAIPTTGCGVTKGSCLGGYYLTASFATQVQSVNTAINNGIKAAAQSAGVPVVPVDQIFSGIYSGDPSNQYFLAAYSVNPGKCCTLAFGGGLLSFDGLHPSDTGYAFLAQAWVQTVNTAFGLGLTAITPASAYNGTGGIYASYPDPYAQH
jgi:lysophospholipase L1-like esterase